MAKLYARFNHARWIADCPNCNGSEYVKPGRPFICYSCFAEEHPEAFERDSFGMLTPRAVELQARAHELCENYDVAFPKNLERIMDIARKHPRHKMNWIKGIPIDKFDRIMSGELVFDEVEGKVKKAK